MVDTTIIPGHGISNNIPGGVRFADLLPQVDADQAREHLEAVFGQTRGYVGLSLLPTGQTRTTVHGFDTWADGRACLNEADDTGRGFWSFCTNDYPRWNAYVQVGSTLLDRPADGSRGRAQDALELPGLFADLDVKANNGTFRTRDELNRFIARLPEPTLLVNTAGPDGGVHGYWLYDAPHEVTDRHERNALDGWWDYLNHVASEFGRTVDHVQEYARVLRVAGTIRWPRRGREPGEPDTWRSVELVKSDGPRYAYEELLELTEPRRRVAVESHTRTQEEWREVRNGQLSWLEGLGLDRAAQALVEGLLNAHQDWGPLLEAAGWRLCRDNRGRGGTTDCRYWTRPGKNPDDGHSAMTDFGDSLVMYIYTEDPLIEPCLIPVGDRFRKITTKYAFALHFLAGGDEAKLVKAIHKGKGRIL